MKGAVGFVVNTVACLFMLTFIVIFSFPVCEANAQDISSVLITSCHIVRDAC